MNPLCRVLLCLACCSPAAALDRPWISDVFFYWYTWDYDQEQGRWIGGIHNTPLDGYYDSRTFRDNRRSLWQASEWGLTHHFMDYWGRGWLGDKGEPRETTVMRAAEDLQRAGYDIWMGYYQDGQNFDVREFSRNVSEKRDVYHWLRDYARSPVWPKISGEPFQLVYARNGRPKTTIDHEGFRRYLAERYGSAAKLNVVWGSKHRSFADVEMTFAGSGHSRADAVDYQFLIWQREWAKLNRLVREQTGLPGVRASFDVGYQPYSGFGFSQFARVLGGPHSYAGIFGPPHDQDAQRYIQAAVAKKHGTVFLDHFKNFYFDWDIRVPGAAYLPDPFHFDRFWVGALARHSEALLHLSWNEWWEGSNLEPCREYGKLYCEKNLLYSTVMKLGFESIRSAGRGAPVAVVLNDWRFASGAQFHEELYETIQILRRLNVPFDLLPDDLITAEQLRPFRLIIAPAYGCGLGYNSKHERILDLLVEWLGQGDRRLVVSAHESIANRLGVTEAARPDAQAGPRGKDMNVFVDVGSPGDEQFLLSGRSHRENWGRLPKGAFGAGSDFTARWTPREGRETTFVLPASPNRDHVLRLSGRSIWANRVDVLVNDTPAASVDVSAGAVSLTVAVPAGAFAAGPMAKVQLRYAQAHVPMERAPKRYPTEARVCNVAIDWVQWSTANVRPRTLESRYSMPKETITLGDGLFGDSRGEALEVPFRFRGDVRAPGSRGLSRCSVAAATRDLVLPFGPSQVLYVNGPLSEVGSDGYWLPLIAKWAGVAFTRYCEAAHAMSSRLTMGDTEVIVCFNERIEEPVDLALRCPARDVPLSEGRVLSRDGRNHEPLAVSSSRTVHQARDTMAYYGVYQFAFAPVRITTPRLAVPVGEAREFPVRVTNLTDRPVQGTVRAASIIPTVGGPAVEVELAAREAKTAAVPIRVAATADWGRKTVYFELRFAGRRAVVLRDLVVQKPAEVALRGKVIDAAEPALEVAVPDNPYGETAPLAGASVAWNGQTVALPLLEEGQAARVPLPTGSAAAPARAELRGEKARLSFRRGGKTVEQALEVFVARTPKSYRGPNDAASALVLFNPRPKPLAHEPIAVRPASLPRPVCVRTSDGVPVASQIDHEGRLRFLATMPGQCARTYYVCRSTAAVESDLRWQAQGLGTGRGTLRVRTSHLSVALSEAAGGTAVELRSLRTGRDYGQRSFGVSYGTFSRHDPAKPRTNTVLHIHEEKVRQEDTPGKVAVLSAGPAAVIARVSWSDDKVRVEQTYRFVPYQPYFVLRQRVEPVGLAGVQELVGINGQFKPNGLNKSYPNFVGKPSGKPQPHFGWRFGPWVPRYATLMRPSGYDESLSLVVLRDAGLVGIRQGFWPAKRPEAGPCETAQVEFLADRSSGCNAEVVVFLHRGYQIVAKHLRADLTAAPVVRVVTQPKWAERTQPVAAPPQGWYSPQWGCRLPLSVAAAGEATAAVDLAALAGGPIDPGSVRVVATASDGAMREVPAAYAPADKSLQWQLPASGLGPHARLHAYFDRLDRGPKAASWLALAAKRSRIVLETFDGEREGWHTSGCEFAPTDGRAGSAGVRFHTTTAKGASLLLCSQVGPRPHARYKVTLYAKTSTPGAALRTNFYVDPRYDFPQEAIPLRSDGRWHRHEATVRVGEFPAALRPMFRLWLLGKPGTVTVDDLSLEPVTAARAGAQSVVGGVETYP